MLQLLLLDSGGRGRGVRRIPGPHCRDLRGWPTNSRLTPRVVGSLLRWSRSPPIALTRVTNGYNFTCMSMRSFRVRCPHGPAHLRAAGSFVLRCCSGFCWDFGVVLGFAGILFCFGVLANIDSVTDDTVRLSDHCIGRRTCRSTRLTLSA